MPEQCVATGHFGEDDSACTNDSRNSLMIKGNGQQMHQLDRQSCQFCTSERSRTSNPTSHTGDQAAVVAGGSKFMHS